MLRQGDDKTQQREAVLSSAKIQNIFLMETVDRKVKEQVENEREVRHGKADS